MSLYSGIKFSAGDAVPTTANAPKAASNHAGPSKPMAVLGAETAKSTKAQAGFSAALKFAPRVNKSKPAASTSKPTTTYINPTYTSASVIERQPESRKENDGLIQNESTQSGEKVMAKIPAMVLNESKKGFKREGDAERRKRKKKEKRRQKQQFVSDFKADEQYDPNQPNDLAEYQHYRKRLKAEKRAQLIADKMRKAAGGSSGESSYYSDSEDDAPRRDAPKLFAPPRMYSPPRAMFAAPPIDPPPPPPPPASSSNAAATGDDAYARRAALSRPQNGDDAYAQRASLSTQAPRFDSSTSATSTDTARPPPPNFTSTPSGEAPPRPVAAPAADTSGIPGFGGYQAPPAAQSSAAPESAPSPAADARSLQERMAAAAAIAAKYSHLTAGPVMPSVSSGYSNALSSSAAPPVAPKPHSTPIPPEEESGTFAEKMMKRWGHVEGTGIGARADGIVHALTTEHVINQPDASKLSKRQLAKAKLAAANAKKRKWVQAPSARGKIVNANAEIKSNEEKGKYGEESRVICLTNLSDGLEFDDDLSGEIGDECSKWGIVERVVLHLVEPQPEEKGEALRVFVVFSGMAGAWRAVKELDGRLFDARNIRARYFNESKFDSGDRDGSLT